MKNRIHNQTNTRDKEEKEILELKYNRELLKKKKKLIGWAEQQNGRIRGNN